MSVTERVHALNESLLSILHLVCVYYFSSPPNFFNGNYFTVINYKPNNIRIVIKTFLKIYLNQNP